MKIVIIQVNTVVKKNTKRGEGVYFLNKLGRQDEVVSDKKIFLCFLLINLPVFKTCDLQGRTFLAQGP